MQERDFEGIRKGFLKEMISEPRFGTEVEMGWVTKTYPTAWANRKARRSTAWVWLWLWL